MRFLLLTLVLMAACFYYSTAQANSFEDCCLKYIKIKSPRRIQKHIVSYRVQKTGGSCNLPAVILKLRNVSICVNPKEKWVRNYINFTEKNPSKRRCKHRTEFCKYWRKGLLYCLEEAAIRLEEQQLLFHLSSLQPDGMNTDFSNFWSSREDGS